LSGDGRSRRSLLVTCPRRVVFPTRLRDPEVGPMPKWEVCVVTHRSETQRTSGFFGEEETQTKWQAILLEVTGSRTVIAETDQFEGSPHGGLTHDFPSCHRLRGLIAQLGLLGWEPISWEGGWHFKRQLPD